MHVSRHALATLVFVIVTTTTVAACSDGLSIPSGGLFGGTPAPGCVDATGNNSTPEEIMDAMLAMEVEDPVTGQKKTMAENMQEQVAQMNEMFDFVEPRSPQELRQAMLDELYKDVPEGGDAAFSAAVCDMLGGWGMLGAGWGDEARIAATPHVLRSIGRGFCGMIEGSHAEVVLKDEAEEVEAAKTDPEKLKARWLADADAAIKMNSELGPDNPLAADLGNLRKTRDELAATPATDLADNLETMHRIKWLAVEHQCPTLSRFGFGPECGEYLMGPEGNTIGIIKLENDTLSCDDARNIIDNHFVTTGYLLQPAPELNSELDDYLCYEFHEGVDENDIPMYMECAPAGESPVKTAWVFIKPKD